MIRKLLFTSGLAFCLTLSGFGQDLPDLVPVDLQWPSTISAPPRPTAQISWSVTNQGTGEALGFWFDYLYLSRNPWLDDSAVYVWNEYISSALEPGDSYERTIHTSLPLVTSGPYYLLLKVNANGFLQESDSGNDVLAVPFTFEATPADLAPVALVAPSVLTGPPNPFVTVAWAVTNQGPGTAYGGWSDRLYLSSIDYLDPSAFQVDYRYEGGSVPAGGRYWRTNTIRLPVVDSGLYFLIFQADSENSLFENVTNNNIVVAPINFVSQPPDLAPLAVQVPTTITCAPNASLTLSWGVTNQGAGAAIGYSSWWDELFLSTNATLDNTAYQLTSGYETGPIAPGASYWRTNTVRIPPIESGNYYVIFKTDIGNTLHDANPANNTLAVPVAFTIVRPDIVPLAEVPPVVNGPPYPYVTLSFGATNQGAGQAIGYWSEALLFSVNSTMDSPSYLFSSYFDGVMAPGAKYWQTNTVRLPAVQDGTYYLAFQADPSGWLFESDRSNNILVVPITVHILPPDLSPIALQLPTSITSPPNPQITFVWGVTNRGTGDAVGNGSWTDLLYISTNSVWDSTATLIGNAYEAGPIAAGGSYWRTNVLHLPITNSGVYYFTFKTDGYGNLIESDESNNSLSLAVGFTVQPPDLVPLISQIPASFTGPPNPTMDLVWGVTNQGIGLASGYWSGWYDGMFLSSDPILDDQDTTLTGYLPGGPLPAGQSYWYTNTVRVPITNSGLYYLIFKADQYNYVFESDKANNVAAVPVSFTVLPPDLAPIDLQVPALITGSPNPTVTVVWGITNQGIGPATMGNSVWSDTLYLSRNATLDNSDAVLISDGPRVAVPAGGNYWRTNTFRLPVVTSGNYYLILKADANNWLFESDESNNTLSVPVRVEILPPDLAAIAFVVPNSVIGPPNPNVTLVWGVTNQGTGVAEPPPYWSWSDRVQLSTNNVLDTTATFVASWSESGPVPAGGSYWRTNVVHLPVTQSGTYYLFFTADADRQVHESSFANNTAAAAVALTILPADLAVLGLQVPPVISGPPKPEVTLSWGVTNQGIGPAVGPWTDIVKLSDTPQFDYSTSWQVTYNSETGPLPVGESYWRTNTVRLPVVHSGTYYFLFSTDDGDSLLESDLSNNQLVVPATINILPPDLAPIALQVPSTVVGPPNPSVTVAWGITNQGLGAAIGDWAWYDEVFLCAGPTLDSGATQIGSFYNPGPIAPGGSYWSTNTFRLPVIQSGTYYLLLVADADSSLYESNFTNNQLAVPVTFNIQPPDLAPIVFRAPSVITGPPQPSLKLMWGVTNQGSGTASGNPYWSEQVHLSSDPVLDQNDLFVGSWSENGPVTPGGNYWRSETVRLPVTQSGTYYLILSLDPDQTLHEANYSNNMAVVPITINIAPPDLAPLVLQAPASISGPAYPTVTFAWGITNQGSGPAGADPARPWPWLDAVYLSTDTNWDFSDLWICSSGDLQPVPPGGIYWRTNTARVPVTQSGKYYFILRADVNDTIPESNETNNTLVLPVTFNLTPPDLAPIALEVPSVIVGAPNPSFSISYGVTNQGVGEISPDNSWSDQLWLSNSTDASLTPIGWFYQSGPLLPGQSYWRTNLVRVPVLQEGTYWLVFKANTDSSIYEANTSNNSVVVPVTFKLQPSDVAPMAVQCPSTISGPSYLPLTVTWAVTNQGPSAAVGGWGWRQAVYVSTVPVMDSNALEVAEFEEPRTLGPGEVEWMTNTVYLWLNTNAQYYLLVQANLYNSLQEANTTNDIAVVPFKYELALPDLAPILLLAPDTVSGPPGQPVEVVWAITNQGPGSLVGTPWFTSHLDVLGLSKTTNFDDALVVQQWPETNSLPPGGTYWRTNRVFLPTSQSDNYYLILAVNSSPWPIAQETDFSNNLAIRPITLDIRPPDLAVLGLQAPAFVTGQSYPLVTVSFGVTNQGTGPALAPPFRPGQYVSPLADGLYLSDNPTIEPSDPWRLGPWPFATWRRTNIAPGAAYWQTNQVRVPIANSGSYYLVLKADTYDVVAESDKANNALAVPVTFSLSPPADLVAATLLAPRVVTGAGNPAVTLVWQVINDGLGPISDSWYDTLTLEETFGPTTLVSSFFESNSLPVGAGYWRTNTVILPITTNGDYRLTFTTGSGVYDLDSGNNTLTVPISFNITGPPVVRIGTGQRFPDGTFILEVYGAIGEAYRLEASSDLQTWTRVLDFVCTQLPTTLYDLAARQFDSRFYRVAPLTSSPELRLRLDAASPWPGLGLLWQLDGPVGVAYRIEASSDLLNWETLQVFDGTLAPLRFVDPQASGQAYRFYRAVQE